MANVSGRVGFNCAFSQALTTQPTNAGNSPAVSAPMASEFNAQNGTGADKIDLKYTKTLNLAGAAQVLDLKSLTDIEGTAVAFVRIRSITLRLRGAADGDVLKLGYATTTTNAWVSLVSNPGQILLQAYSTSTNGAFFVVTAPGVTGYIVGASNKLLNLDPGAATFSVDIEITGVSA